jgi:hypothetical protein
MGATKERNHNRLLIQAAVLIGLGLLGWIYLGRDLKRYIRISTM